MSVALGISSQGNFVTQDVLKVFGAGGTVQDAGVTDMVLFNKMNQEVFSGSAATDPNAELKFLNTLSPDQLDEVTIGDFNSGPRLTTYGDLKLYDQITTDLGDHMSVLVSGSIMAFNTYCNATSSSPANATQAEAVRVYDIASDLAQNKPGCIKEVEDYLTSAQASTDMATPDVCDSAAAGTKTAASKIKEWGNPGISLSAKEIMEILGHHDDEGKTAGSFDDWATSSNDTLLDQAATDKIKDIANTLNTVA